MRLDAGDGRSGGGSLKPLALALVFLLQTPAEPTVAIILNGQEQTLKVKDAESMLANIDQLQEPERTRIMAALVIGLGTDPTYCTEGQIDAELCLPHQARKLK